MPTIALAYEDEFLPNPDALDLLGYIEGAALEENGWQMISGNGGNVIETLRLSVRGSTRAARETIHQYLARYKRRVRESRQAVDPYGLWMRVSTNDSGTDERRAFVNAISVGGVGCWGQFTESAIGGYYYLHGSQIAIERFPYWEDTGPIEYSGTGISAVAGTYDYTTYVGSPGAVKGDVDARISVLTLTRDSAGTQPLQKFWVGFRTNRFGNRANFQAYWSLRKGATFGADTTGGAANADAEAKDGFKAVCTFATSTGMVNRVRIRTSDVTANPIDQRGGYIVLLRAKNTAGGETRVRLADGYYGSDSYRVQSRVSITSTSYQFYELGTVDIPTPGDVPYGLTTAVNSYSLGIDAERLSGAASLDMDCLVLIPREEGYVSATGGSNISSIGANATFYYHNRPGGTKDVSLVVGGVPVRSGEPNSEGGLPVSGNVPGTVTDDGKGILVLAAQQETISILAQTAAITMQVVKRWEVFRGSE